MLNIPQGDHPGPQEVDLDEPSSTLDFVTSFCRGGPVPHPKSQTFLVLADALRCADKYDIAHLYDFIRIYISARWEHLSKQPIDLYIFVRNQGWDEYIWRASRNTLHTNIRSHDACVKIDGLLSRKHAALLRSLHRHRKALLNDRVTSIFYSNITKTPSDWICPCNSPLRAPTRYHLVACLDAVIQDIDNRPVGEFLRSVHYWVQRGITDDWMYCTACDAPWFDVHDLIAAMSSTELVQSLRSLHGLY